MAKAEPEQQSAHRRQNRFLLMLLVGATLVSAAKDLGRLHDLTSGLVGLAASLHQRVNNAVQSPAEPGCPLTLAEKDRSGQPYNWNGRVAPDQLAQMKSSDGGIDAVPAVGGDLLLVAFKNSSCREPIAAQIARRAIPVASGALHPEQSSSRRKTAESGRNRLANQSATIRVRNNVRLKFIVRVPEGVEFVSRMINDEIKGNSPASSTRSIRICPIATLRLDAHPVNDRFNFYTGYAQALMQTKILGKEVKAYVAVPNCTDAVAFKTADGIISLDLLRILRATLAPETRNDETVSDFPRTLKGMIQRTVPAAPAVAEDAH